MREPVDLRAAMCETNADCVIVASRDGRLPPDCQNLLAGFARVKLVQLVEEGSDGFVWHLEPRREWARAMTQEDLLNAIGAG